MASQWASGPKALVSLPRVEGWFFATAALLVVSGIQKLLDPMPTEIHVLLAQLSGRPLLVATGDPQRVWLVTGERIAEMRP